MAPPPLRGPPDAGTKLALPASTSGNSAHPYARASNGAQQQPGLNPRFDAGQAQFYNNIRNHYAGLSSNVANILPTRALPSQQPVNALQPNNGKSNYNPHRRQQARAELLADSSHAGLLKATNIPIGTTQRIFRKKIGQAVAAAFPDPPRFKTHIRSSKGKPEYGTILFPNVDCCHRFLRHFSHHSRNSVEISKHRLQFRKEDPTSQHITQQEAACLRYKSTPHGNISDYEDEGEDEPADVYIQHVEAGVWDAQGRFAPAWCSKEVSDRYSTLSLDGDQAKLVIRIEDQLITTGLYSLESIIVHEKDLYVSNQILPTFLDDESHGYAALKQTVGLMDTNAVSVDTTSIRIPALDDEHAKVAPFCYVYKLRCSSRNDIDAFLTRWKRKLIDVVEYYPIERNWDSPFANHWLINIRRWLRTLPFELAFQAQRLLQAGYIMPSELVSLQPAIERISESLSPVKAGRLFQLVAKSASYRGPAQAGQGTVASLAAEIAHLLNISTSGHLGALEHDAGTGYFDIHATSITPAGLFLEGPHRDSGNRIVRQFPGKESYFMRVRLQDENFDIIREAREVNNDRCILSGRMRKYLLEGIEIGGRKFHFLAFSTSSLKEHSTWFVANFVYEGKQVSAQSIRDGIGDLHVIKTPALYAARMGQAFTSTAFSLEVESDKIHRIPDVSRNSYNFSDGCGVISYDTLKRLHEMDTRRRRNRRKNALPTVFQIRLGGAKGVLSLHTDFNGWAVGLRPSMIKFRLQADTVRNQVVSLEVANSADTALPTNLNRPMVALLETLGVPPSSFIEIQTRAVKELSAAATDTVAALKMYRSAGFGTGPDCSDLLQTLRRVLGIRGITDVPFLKRCNLTCLTSSLRQIKYKARCKVDEAWTLMGIMDETGWLQPGQIYVQLRDNRTSQVTYLTGHCIIGRSPYLAPGDAQFAVLAGTPPPGSSLHNVYNCVVFSQQGTRPLCTKLAGGDLDGDLYNVIKNPLLFPQFVEEPAPYHSSKAQQLDRECTIEDVVDFLLLFCQTDRLGMIADRHLLISDRSYLGVRDPDCIKLAELASIAVDYQKTGIAPELSKMPRLKDSARPDYFQSEHRVESQARSLNRRAQWQRESRTYYESKKALGQMFRKIDVDADIAAWGKAAPQPLSEDKIRDKYWSKIRPWLKDDWLVDIQPVLNHVQTFYNQLEFYAQEFAPERRRDALSEPELFMGCILGRFNSRFGSNSRGYNAQVTLRDDVSELIDQTMKDQCQSDSWSTPVITAANLALKEQEGGDIQTLKTEVEGILTSLARWIRAAEMFEDTLYAGSDAAMASDASARSSKKKKGDHYETAKWIAIGPALKKVEELQVFMAHWTAQIEARLARLKVTEADDAAGRKANVNKVLTYITNAPM